MDLIYALFEFEMSFIIKSMKLLWLPVDLKNL